MARPKRRKIREACIDEPIEYAQFVWREVGAGLLAHNYLCAVCRDNPAVLESWRGWLQPCWDCQLKGYKLVRPSRFWREFLRLFGIGTRRVTD